MTIVLILATLAGITFLIYMNLPTKQEVYDDEQKEKNLLVEIEDQLKKDM